MNFHKAVEKCLLGSIVITRYNNKTYRIDEIDWTKTPSDEFEGRDGVKTSYQKYYAERYNKSIRDPKQPLIISMPKVCHVSSCYETCPLPVLMNL